MSTWLFDSLLVTSLLMAAILIVRRPVAKLFGAGVAYALWLIPAARMLMPSLSGTPVVQASESSQAVRDAVRESILSGVATNDAAVAIATSPTIDFAALAVAVWLGGGVLFFIVQMIRYALMRDDLLCEAEQIAIIDDVNVVASDQVAGPLAFGLFKRYIAVPLDFTKTYSPAERELAIAHELAHHKSGDLFANLAAFIVLCLQWFNPLAWLSWNAFRFDQEAACDARVLAGKCAEERAIYGQALARTAFDGVPTFATALNSPKTIIERLKRLTMKDASRQRRSLGKLGIFTAAALILPLTATVVPAMGAQEATAPADAARPKVVKKHVKIITIHEDGKAVDANDQDHDGKEVTKISRDGKTLIIRTDKTLSQGEVDKIMAEAEEARAKAAEARSEAHRAMDKALGEREAAKMANDHTEIARVHNMALAHIPEIDIREIVRNCKDGEPVTTDVSGIDGQKKARVKIVMCGRGQAKIARLEAIKGLREARNEIADEADMPQRVRKDVMEKLEEQIRRLEAEVEKP